MTVGELSRAGVVGALDMANLLPLMELTEGRADVGIGLIDGEVAAQLSAFSAAGICTIGVTKPSTGIGREHGTFVAAMLSASRSSVAPAISPGCSLVVRPVFDHSGRGSDPPRASAETLGEAIFECVDAGVRVINLSVAAVGRSGARERALRAALDYAMQNGVLVVAAAGNLGRVGGSAITAHPWVTAVVGLNARGRPLPASDLGPLIARHGLSAPGEDIVSLSSDGRAVRGTGTSVAAPLVTGAIALLYSEFPTAPAAAVRWTLSMPQVRRRSLVPPKLDAWGAYLQLREMGNRW